MTELEQRLINEFGKLAEQYAEHHRKMGVHITKLTGAYEALNNSCNTLVKDLEELIR